MITEDYVSFETAKLLKEKGFIGSGEIGCRNGFYSERYYEQGYGIITQSGIEVGIVYDDLDNTEVEQDEYLRPTIQMTMRWLLEKHNLLVIVDYEYECDDTPYYYKIYKLGKFGEPELIPVEGVSYDKNGKEQKHLIGLRQYRRSYEDYATYQSAAEGGIVYCLENLI